MYKAKENNHSKDLQRSSQCLRCGINTGVHRKNEVHIHDGI